MWFDPFSLLTNCPLQMSLKKGGAADEVPKALRYLLATSEELKEVEEQSQTTGQVQTPTQPHDPV